MQREKPVLSTSVSSILAALLFATVLPADGQPARLEQTLDAFYSPSSVAVAKDGRTFFVTNCARGEWGLIAGRGAVSKLRMNEESELVMVDPRFVNHLNAPLSLAIFPIAVGGIPEGSIAVTVGSAWAQTARGVQIRDSRERGTGIMIFDAESGDRLAHIYGGPDSRFARALGHPLRDPKGIAIDPTGAIYLTDSAGAATAPVSESEGRPGLVKVLPDALAALLEERDLPDGSIQFLHVPTSPTDVVFCETNDCIYWTTASAFGDLGQAIFRLGGGDFSGATEIETIARGAGPMYSVAVTPSGTILAGRGDGTIVFVRGSSRVHPVNFREQLNRVFLGPGHMAVTMGHDDRLRVIVPEIASGTQGPWRQRVNVISLPARF